MPTIDALRPAAHFVGSIPLADAAEVLRTGELDRKALRALVIQDVFEPGGTV